MKIYIAHSRLFDFQNELYLPIKNSHLSSQHQFVFPHDATRTTEFSRDIIKTCQLLVAEVSFPSTGLGIELGWAYDLNVPIICLHKPTSPPSSSVSSVSQQILTYSSSTDLINTIDKAINIK
ncbi:MAG: hypothetical protein WCV93_01775 [Candidatus Shapirobacteria bacterium]|jgi:hypothetical protein